MRYGSTTRSTTQSPATLCRSDWVQSRHAIRPLLRAVENAQDSHGVARDAIGRNVGRAVDHQLSRAFDAAGATALGEPCQRLHLFLEPLVDNKPTANVIVWSVLSLVALLGGIGLLFAAFGRWNFLGWHGREEATLSFRAPGDVALTPAQRATAWFFFVMSALFLVQVTVGAASQHYRAELADFFGIDLAQWFPYNLMRTWHLQLAIFWVATAFLAAGIFLAPMIAGREPRRQSWLAYGLLGALAIVVGGTLLGGLAAIHGWIDSGWSTCA